MSYPSAGYFVATSNIRKLTHCPECGVKWLGKKIPKSDLRHYPEGQTRYNLLLITNYPGEKDKFHCTCPCCKTSWDS